MISQGKPLTLILREGPDGLRRGRFNDVQVHGAVRLNELHAGNAILVRPLSQASGYHGVNAVVKLGIFKFPDLTCWSTFLDTDGIEPAGTVLLPRRLKAGNRIFVSNRWHPDGKLGPLMYYNMGVIIDRDPEKPHVAVCRFSDGPNPVPDFTSLVVELALLDLGPRPKLEEKDGYWLPPEDPVYLDIWQHIVL